MKKDIKKPDTSAQDFERMELLQKVHNSKGMQLKIDPFDGSLKEIDELKNMIGKGIDDPEEKYKIYYKGIRRMLNLYLPKGEAFKADRQLIYDEMNVFLSYGKKKSDGNGVRGYNTRMTYNQHMPDLLDILISWVAESRNYSTLYQSLYDLNEKYSYGHEIYDLTSRYFHNAMKLRSLKNEQGFVPLPPNQNPNFDKVIDKYKKGLR